MPNPDIASGPCTAGGPADRTTSSVGSVTSTTSPSDPFAGPGAGSGTTASVHVAPLRTTRSPTNEASSGAPLLNVPDAIRSPTNPARRGATRSARIQTVPAGRRHVDRSRPATTAPAGTSMTRSRPRLEDRPSRSDALERHHIEDVEPHEFQCVVLVRPERHDLPLDRRNAGIRVSLESNPPTSR